MTSDERDLIGFIRRLPKAELHLHLEGTILPATLVELSARHDTHPLTLAQAEALYRFTDFTGFIESFKAITRRLLDPEDYRARRMADDGASCRAGGGPRRGLYLRRRYLHVAQLRSALLRAHLRCPRTRPRARRPRAGSLALLDLRRRPPLHRRGGRSRLPQGRRMRAQYPSIIGIGLGGDERHTGSEPFRRSTPRPALRPSASPTTRAKPPAPRPSGKRSPLAPNGSAMRSPPSTTNRSSRN